VITKASFQKIKKIIFFIKPYRGRLIILIVTHLFRSALSIALLYLPFTFLKDPNIGAIKAQVMKFAPLFGFLILGSVLITIGYTYLNQYVGTRIVYDIRRYFYKHLQVLSLRFYSNKPTGEIMSRLLADVQNIQGLLTATILMILDNTFRFVALAIVVFTISFKLSLVALIPFPFYLISVIFFGRVIRSLALRLQRELAEVSAFIQESFSGIKLIKSFVREKLRLGGFEDRTDRLAKTIVKTGMVRCYQGQINYLLQWGGIVILFIFGYYEIQKGNMNLLELLYFYGMLQMMTGPLLALFQMNLHIQQTMASVDRVLEYLEEQPEIRNIENPVIMEAIRRGIRFRDLSFSYEDDKLVLSDIDLEIKKNETVALVGYSGSGKSTMVSLLCRFYDPQRGAIEVDGRDLKDYDVASWRDATGMVDQDTFLFHTTIIDNVRFSRPDATDEEVENACRAAYLHDFILSLPMGYQTLCGERGVKLSGGEKQRLSIARAILKDPQILILDEATSSLDSKTENIIKKAVERLLENRTSIIIAHRLSTIMQADRIVVMEQGRIVETGSYQALLSKKGVFARLHSEQVFQQQDPASQED
jgi:ABC-type multidrug transport system fused ATPase/permease subunit